MLATNVNPAEYSGPKTLPESSEGGNVSDYEKKDAFSYDKVIFRYSKNSDADGGKEKSD